MPMVSLDHCFHTPCQNMEQNIAAEDDNVSGGPSNNPGISLLPAGGFTQKSLPNKARGDGAGSYQLVRFGVEWGSLRQSWGAARRSGQGGGKGVR